MSKSKTRAPRLGRGLSSLMAQPVQIESDGSESGAAVAIQKPSKPDAQAGLTMLPLAAISANPHQPRQKFDTAALQTLAESIRSDGLLQPIVVRPAGDGRYEVAAGERRLRAAELAGLAELPAIVRELDDQQLAELALIENLQREDLNAIERALGFQHLVDQFQLSHEQIAQRVGVERPTVSNSLRLLGLCDSVRRMVQDGPLSGGHGKALAALADAGQQELLAKQAIRQAWSVRQLETAVRRLMGAADGEAAGTSPTGRSAHLVDLEQQIGGQLGAKVRISAGRKKGTGTLAIRFSSLDEFDQLLARLGVETT